MHSYEHLLVNLCMDLKQWESIISSHIKTVVIQNGHCICHSFHLYFM